jgi:hypothetical protein
MNGSLSCFFGSILEASSFLRVAATCNSINFLLTIIGTSQEPVSKAC